MSPSTADTFFENLFELAIMDFFEYFFKVIHEGNESGRTVGEFNKRFTCTEQIPA